MEICVSYLDTNHMTLCTYLASALVSIETIFLTLCVVAMLQVRGPLR